MSRYAVTRSVLLCLAAGTAVACANADTVDDTPDAFPTRTDSGTTSPVDAAPRPDANQSVACTQALAALRFDFESGAQGFVHAAMPIAAGSGQSWTFDSWDQGPVTAGRSCIQGDECFATNLSGNYVQCQRAYLVSPPVDLSACASPGQDVSIFFQHNFNFWSGDEGGPRFDGGLVEISADGTNWQSATILYPGTIDINPSIGGFSCIENESFYVDGKDGYVGNSGGWLSENFSIPEELRTVTFQVRFVYGSGVSTATNDEATSQQGTRPGWHIDNLRFQ